MEVLINSDNNVESTVDFKNEFREQLQHSLRRFESYITRFEVFFSDESSNKETINDHKCVIEARIKGRDPERVSHNANSAKEAFDGAIDKMKTVLDRVVDQQRRY